MMTGWKLFWYQVKCICRKEFLAIMKDKAFRRILVIPVIFTGILFGYAATFNVTYISYGVLDQSHSEASASLLARLDGTGFFHRAATLQNASQIAAIMDTEQAMMVLAIPQDFTQRLERGEKARLQLITDGRNTMTASLASAYTGRVVASWAPAGYPGTQNLV